MDLLSRSTGSVVEFGCRVENYYGLSLNGGPFLAAVYEKCFSKDYESLALYSDIPGGDMVCYIASIKGEIYFVKPDYFEKIVEDGVVSLVEGSRMCRGARRLLEMSLGEGSESLN